jgi:AraC family transcriptional regulator, regulatory protein of adaptative response / methylated-DNA-[protein]-cysteine methyltransferase
MDYARIERAMRFLNLNYLQRPALDEIAAQVHLSPFHFERLFQRWAGTSPKRFLQFLTKERAKTLLRDSPEACSMWPTARDFPDPGDCTTCSFPARQ